MKLFSLALINVSLCLESRKDPNCADFDISVKCENYCTQLFLQCLSGCDDDNCYGECHRNDYVCVDSCPCHTDCISGCEGCENPICNCKGYQDDASWQTCTQSKCPFLTNCIFGCDSDECFLECIRQFKTVHEDCPCEANCPLGCPCDNYDCDNDESDDDVTINGPISVQEDNFMAKLDYSDNFEISFEYKASSLPSLQSKPSPKGENEDEIFALWHGYDSDSSSHVIRMNGSEIDFFRELVTDKWYKIDIKQSKGDGNRCDGKTWWQNELVAEHNIICPTYESTDLYIAGDWGYYFDGQVRNFSYVKK